MFYGIRNVKFLVAGIPACMWAEGMAGFKALLQVTCTEAFTEGGAAGGTCLPGIPEISQGNARHAVAKVNHINRGTRIF